MALNALKIGAGDEVVVTPRTFLVSASSIANAGAKPIFADLDRDSQNITAETIQAVLMERTKAIICVHLSGSRSEVYLEKAFDNIDCQPKERLPTARELGETSLMFLVHPTLTQAEIAKTCEVIQQVISEASA